MFKFGVSLTAALLFLLSVFQNLNVVVRGLTDRQQDILYAAEFGKVDELQKYIDAGDDVEMAWQETSPLIVASAEGRVEAVKLLLKAGVDVNVQARDGTRPITVAAYFGHEEVLKVLLDAKADFKFIDVAVGVSNPLIVASAAGHTGIMKILLDRGIYIDSPSHSGDTALIIAALDNRISSLNLLLERGANIEAKNHQNNTALLAAAFRGHGEVVEILLKHGANYKFRNKDGRIAMTLAAEGGHARCVRALAKAGADVNDIDPVGTSPLVHAARSGKVETMRILIEYGADLEAIDEVGSTALQIALTHNHQKAVKLLSLAGASYGPADGHHGINFADIPKIDTCEWLRALLKAHKLPNIHQKSKDGVSTPMKACDWVRKLGFEGSIVPLLDQVHLYGYKAMVRLLNFDLFSRGTDEDEAAVAAIKKKAYLDIKDMHQKEYRATYRETDEDVIEDRLPHLLRDKFGVNITLPEELEAQQRAAYEAEHPPPVEENLPQIHRPPPEERPEYAKAAPGEEDIEKIIGHNVVASTEAVDESLSAEL